VAFPFDPTRKLVSRAWDLDGVRWLAVSGSPKAVLDRRLETASPAGDVEPADHPD